MPGHIYEWFNLTWNIFRKDGLEIRKDERKIRKNVRHEDSKETSL
jgi:hypothetical protein